MQHIDSKWNIERWTIKCATLVKVHRQSSQPCADVELFTSKLFPSSAGQHLGTVAVTNYCRLQSMVTTNKGLLVSICKL